MNEDNEFGPAISYGYAECNEWNYRLFPLSLFSFHNAELQPNRHRRVEIFVDQYLQKRNPQNEITGLAHSPISPATPIQSLNFFAAFVITPLQFDAR